ncbi:hypothetical protein [Microvirga sp. VF16]|uniref:DUF6894 family protein n=1 Tax=Microvirga sp. VF16 TaxID=2807101 RepID=UPI0035302B71
MRCYFHLLNHHEELIDDEGVEVPDLESAKLHALIAVSELQREYDGVIEDWHEWRLHIHSSKGSLLHTFPLLKPSS